MVDLPDAPWASAAGPSLPDAPWTTPTKAEERGLLSRLASPITDIPREAYNATAEALSTVNTNLNPFSQAAAERRARGQAPSMLDTGKGMLAIANVPLAPFQGAARSLLGHPLSAADEALRSGATSIYGENKVAPAVGYEGAKDVVDKAMMGLAPRGVSPAGARVVQPPAPPTPNGPLGVTLSEGQFTGELPVIQREQAALRNQMGETAQARAQQFVDQQRAQVAEAGENVAKQLDPFGQRVAETPQEAGQFASEGIQQAAAQRKAAVEKAYDFAKNLPGEIHAGAFEGIGQKIKGDLSLRPDPIIIDDKLTPYAAHAIRDVEDRISKLTIQNRADPFGAPDPQNIVGVDLKGVDQMRRRLSAFRADAFRSGNAADGRAARAVLEAFDNQVDAAVNGGLFRGDPRAVQAWNDARAAHADYKSTFSAGKNDPIGRVVERITGKNGNPAAIPNDVADFLYGSSGTNPSSLNVGVAKRVRSILGDQSPEWSAVKQGMLARLTESGPGVTDWGPGKIAQRLNKFLNADGVELSHALFNPAERKLIQEYANLQRKLEVPQSGANWSNTSTVLAPILRKVSNGIAGLIGGVVGHVIAPGLHGVGEAAGAMATGRIGSAISNARQARQIASQMPLVADQMQKWQRAVNAANRANTPLSQRAVSIAAANLARSLQNVGLDPVALLGQGVIPSRADQQQQHP